MKLAISNIGWESQYNEQVYQMMKRYGFCGIEIAPTVWIPEKPYASEQRMQAKHIATELKENYGFSVCSMQSILYGKQEKLFGTEDDRTQLYEYMLNAIDYASALECGNLVFGCPKNRCLPEGWTNNMDPVQAIEMDFFGKLGDYAKAKGTTLSMEANPPIYNTNYVNTTLQALELVERTNSKGFLLNLDVGTMIQNEEKVADLADYVHLIHHVHISEPGLQIIKQRELHQELSEILSKRGYNGYISIEVGKGNLGDEPLVALEYMMDYVAGIFG